ncbi:hypothetical protein NDU88_001359 [Pleurodeles waltl]|uniref:Uncharacterized protein n=1 Tax=Pleurodeles waltl TaxID=8319 RepID=A0AAV7UWK7_PLEWA|nr:hypothetical protein NDU88_001359 [Pleurodeles waltl]
MGLQRGPNRPLTWDPEALLHASKALPGPAGPDPVLGYLPPSRAEDKAQASGSHSGACHSPGLEPRNQPESLNPNQQRKPPLAQCMPRPSRERHAGGRVHPFQALGCQFALWGARFGGQTNQAGLQGGCTPGHRGRLAWALVVPSQEPLDPRGVRRSLSLVTQRKATPFLVDRAHKGTDGTIGKNAPDLVEPWLGLRKQMSPHWDIRGSLVIWNAWNTTR